ncbi:MAG TPA: cysteine hydrolase family protein [Paralcaligenes sp.]|jgi:Amidases related to nicotinamidase
MLRLRYLPLLAAFAMPLFYTAPSQGETIIDEWQNVKAPPPPALKSVTLDPKTTALLMIDIIKQTCNMKMRPRCVAMVPKVQKLLTEARDNGVYVIYALFPSPKPATFPNPKISDYVPELAAKGTEPVVIAFVDKFMLGDRDTGLQKLLKDKGIKTLIPVGVSSHNGVLFTSVMASLRGFDVVVPVDGMAGNNAYEDQATDYILTSSIVYKVTLTSIDQIKFEK